VRKPRRDEIGATRRVQCIADWDKRTQHNEGWPFDRVIGLSQGKRTGEQKNDSRAKKRDGDRNDVGSDKPHSDGEHTRMIERHGPGEHMMVMSDHDCQNANRSEVNEGTDNNRTRVIVCTRNANGAGNPAQQAEALQRARARVADDNQIPAEQRQRVLAAIDREIARLRGAQ